MNEQAVERLLVSVMADDAGSPPASLLRGVLEQTAHSRPRPTIVALLVEPPMVMPRQVVVGVRRSRVALVLAAGLLAISAAIVGAWLLREPAPDAWSTWGGTAARTGDALRGPVGTPRVRWVMPAGAAPDRTPIVLDGLVVVTTSDGSVRAIDALTGRERWAVAGIAAGPPAAGDALVLVVDDQGTVHARRSGDGSEAWRADIGAMPGPDLAVDRGVVHAGTSDGAVVALDLTSGAVRWRSEPAPGAAPIVGIAAADGRVVAARADGRLDALRGEDGVTTWSAPGDGALPGMPTIAGGVVWRGPGDDARTGQLLGIDLGSGQPRWRLEDPLHAPAVAGDSAVAGSGTGLVVAFDPKTAIERWRFSPGGWFRMVAVADDVAIALSDTQRQVYGLDLASGAVRWQLALATQPGCCLALAQGLLTVVAADGVVTAYEDGSSASASPGLAPSPSPSASTAAGPTAVPSRPATSAAASSAVGSPIRVIRRTDPEAIGLAGPIGIAVAPSGHTYVTDERHRVTELDVDGRVVRRWGTLGDGPGEFDFGSVGQSIGPRGSIAVGRDGQVYVSDGENHRVQVFAADGRFVRAFGSLGAGPGQFTIAYDLAADADGNVYVLDDGAQRITKFGPDGEPIWTADHTTDPRLLGHAHTAAFDSAGRLVVAMDDSATIVRLDPASGQVLEVLPNGACESTVDPWDRILSVDCVTGAVSVLDERGQVLARDPELHVRTLRVGEDGRAVAIGTDGAVIILEVTPP